MTSSNTGSEDSARDTNVPHKANTGGEKLRNSQLHMALLAWKNGDITMIELKQLLAAQRAELLDRVEREVIGEDEILLERKINKKAEVVIDMITRDQLRAEQRQRLQVIRKET